MRERTDHTLKDEILKIHDHFYQNNLEIKKINEYGVDDFIFKENMDFNEYEIKDPSGKQVCEFSAKFAAFDFATEDKSIMVVINDISERARLRESKISEMLKTIMLCSISHELRSPVNQITGVLTLLLPTLKTKEQRQYLRIANSSTELLKLKVDDMLDFYEIETNNFKSEKKLFDPRKVFSYIKAVFSPMVDHENIKIYFFVHDKTPDIIYHDMDRIQQILVNLLSNAIKYTKKGIITVMIDWESRKKNNKPNADGVIKFTVSDTGNGIPRAKKRNLFNFLDPQNLHDYKNGRD